MALTGAMARPIQSHGGLSVFRKTDVSPNLLFVYPLNKEPTCKDGGVINPPILENPPWALETSSSLYNTHKGPIETPFVILQTVQGGAGTSPPLY